MLAGLELLALPLTGVFVHGAIKLVIYLGIGGVFGVLIGVLLIAAGVVLWVNPTHRVFYGVAGIVLGIVSFPASNLGWFLRGMLLAIIGGALAFAWVPAEPGSVDVTPAGHAGDDAPAGRDGGDGEPPAGLDLVSGTRAEWEGTAEIADADAPASDGGGLRAGDAAGHRLLAVAALPTLLVAGLLGTSGAARAASTPQPNEGCILGVLCLPGPSASPSPSQSPSPTPRSSDPGPNPTPSASSPSGPAASGSPSATPSAGSPGTAAPVPTATPTTSGSASPSASASASPATSGRSASGKSASAQRRKIAQKEAAAPSAVTAPAAASVLSAGSVTMTDFQYQGNVSMPVTGGGTEEMMEFTADSAALSGDVTVSVAQGGLTTDTSSPTLGFSDGLTLYATKLCGNLFGLVPKCFTPSTASAVFLSNASLLTAVAPITMTDVTTDQPLATAGALQTGSLAHHRLLRAPDDRPGTS